MFRNPAICTVLLAACSAMSPCRAFAAKEFKDLSKDEMRKTFEAANLADDCYDDNVKARDGYKPSGNFVNSKNITVEGTLPDGRQVFTFNQYKHVVTGSSDLKILDATLNDVGQKMKGNYSSDGKAAINESINDAAAPCAYVYNPENGMITPLSGNDAKNAGYNPNPPNFAAQVLEKDGKTHIAFRGSGASVDDWADTNAGQSLGKVPVQFQMADQLVQSVQDTGSGDVELTGHSEGGGEVQYATLKSVERGENNVTGSAFNYQQLSTGVKSQFSDDVIKEAGNRVTYYRVGNDAVSGAKMLGDGTLGGKEEIHLGDASWKGGTGFGELVDAATGNMGDAHRVVTAIDMITAGIGQKVKDERNAAKEAARTESKRMQDYIDHAQKEKDAIRNEIKELGDKDPGRTAELMDRYKILTEGIDALKDKQKELKEKEDQEKAAKESESNDNGGAKKSGKKDLREGEAPLEDDTDGEGNTSAQGPDGPSLTKFLNDEANENEQKFQEGSTLNQTVAQEREQEAKNEIAQENADNTLNQGGDAAQKIADDSANATANAQDQNSWENHLSDALQQSVTAGLSSIGTTVGNELGNKIADDLTNQLFGDPDKDKGHGVAPGGNVSGGKGKGTKGKDKDGKGKDGKGEKGEGEEEDEEGAGGDGGKKVASDPGHGDSGKKTAEGNASNAKDGQTCHQCGTIGVCYKYYGHWFCADCSKKYYGGKPLTGDTGKMCNDSGKKDTGTKNGAGTKKDGGKKTTGGKCAHCGVSFDKISRCYSKKHGDSWCWACVHEEPLDNVKYDESKQKCSRCKRGCNILTYEKDANASYCPACMAAVMREKAGMKTQASGNANSGNVNGTASSSKGTGKKTEYGAYTCSWCGKKTNSIVSGVGSGVYCSNACYQKFLESRKQGKSSDARGLSVRTSEGLKLKRDDKPAMLPQHGSYYDMKEGKIKSY